MKSIPLFYRADTLNMPEPIYWHWEFDRYCHMLCIGNTNSGKTYTGKLIAARAAKHINTHFANQPANRHMTATICDFKAYDWTFLRGLKNYFEFQDCMVGLNSVYDLLQQRQQGEEVNSFHLLVFDEFASFLNSLPKKEADDAKAKLSTLLMLSRAFNIHTLLIQQRADSDYFAKSRDNFSCVVGMGNLSKEQKGMVFSPFAKEILPITTIGGGYVNCDDVTLTRIQVPRIRNMEALHDDIRKAVS